MTVENSLDTAFYALELARKDAANPNGAHAVLSADEATALWNHLRATPKESGQCEIVTVEIRGGEIISTTMKAPGLPDGLHDLYCADPKEVRPIASRSPLAESF